MLLLRHTFFLNEGYCHWFQRAKGSIIIFFVLHLAGLLIDWTSRTTFHLMCLPKQFWGQIFYFMAQPGENFTPPLLYLSDFHFGICKQMKKSQHCSLGEYRDTHSRIYTHGPWSAGLRRLTPISERVWVINEDFRKIFFWQRSIKLKSTVSSAVNMKASSHMETLYFKTSNIFYLTVNFIKLQVENMYIFLQLWIIFSHCLTCQPGIQYNSLNKIKEQRKDRKANLWLEFPNAFYCSSSLRNRVYFYVFTI